MFRSLSRILAEIGGSQRAAKPRRSARLGVEFLENRWVPSTIAGYVFNDAAGSGAFQPGTDPVYASIPISLLNASGTQIASTTTDNSGHYSFTVNQTVNTTPATKEQDVTFGPASTDSSETQQVTQFDPSLGTLTSVEIDMTGNVSSILKLINLDPKAQTPQATIKGTVTLEAPGANALTANDQAVDSGTTLNPGDTFTYSPTNGQGSATVTITDPAAFAAYLGAAGNPGTVSISEGGQASISNLSSAANLEALINSTFSGQAKVIYHYTPSNTLTPGQYTVVETQNPPNTTNGTPTSNGVPVPPGTPPDTIPVTLPPGGDSLQNNFPKVTTAKVSGFVYQDNNNNGKFDAGDAPIANASVTLSGTPAGGGSAVTMTELTTANGSYSFTVPPGNYTITQPNITGYTRGADTVGNLGGTAAPGALTVSLANGDVGTDYNFGEVLPPPVVAPKVSGFVYQDNNKDGKFDAGDAALPNAVVSITGTPAGGGAAVTQTTLTAANGSYAFTVPPGDYTITQPNITGYTRGADTVGNLGGTSVPGALTVSLASGDVGTDYDFGEVLPPAPPQVNPAKVSGFVYQDNNKDGKFDAGDAALPNAVVTITGTPAGGGSAVTQTTLTAIDGSYAFTVPPGDYTITQPNITGYTRGADTVGNLGGTAAPGALTVSLADGAIGTDYNFGEVLPPAPPQVNPAQVSGFVYQDNNNNGKFDAGDVALPNAVVTITGTPSGGGAAITQTTLTAVNGSYSFSVPPGDYTITQPNITGYTRGADTVGNLGGTAAPGALTVSLASNDVGTDYNFGEVLPPAPPQVNPAKVSGFVYQDNNNNGKFDQGDAAIPNAVVTITGTPAGGGAAITQTTLTAADGSYAFSVAPGNYTITQPNITGYNRGADTVGNLGGTAAPGALTVSLASNDVGTDYNFGEVLPVPTPVVTPAKVTGFVYADNNQNGVFDPGDSAIPNAVVSLTGTPAGGGAAISMTTLTAADGSYAFSVAPGDYTITQPNITGYTRGADTVGNLGGTAAPGALSLSLSNGAVGINYNFGEVQNPPTTPQGPPITPPPPTPQTPPPEISKLDFFGNSWMWGW